MSVHVVLFSGGFDSTVLLLSLIYDKKIDPKDIIALNINYGQRNFPEVYVANKLCKEYNITYDNIDISSIANKIFEVSALVNKQIDIDTEEKIQKDKQPNSYVPNRNMIFLSIAAAYAETIGSHDIYTALQPHEKYWYWDTTEDFIDSLNKVFSLNPHKITIHAPFINMSKKEIFEYAKSIGIPIDKLKRAWSCYNPVIEKDGKFVVYKPCGKCGSCLERNEFLPQDELRVHLSAFLDPEL